MDFEIKDGVLVNYTNKSYKGYVNIPKEVYTIGDGAFMDCYSITKINILETVKNIGSLAFSSCESLKSIYIPDSVEKIGEDVFLGCSRLKSVSIPQRFKTLDIFKYCSDNLNIDYRPEKSRGFDDTPAKYVPEPSESDYKNFLVYKQLFIYFINASGIEEQETILEKIPDDDVKIPFAFKLINNSGSEKAKKYIKENNQKIMHYLVDRKDYENLQKVLEILKEEK